MPENRNEDDSSLDNLNGSKWLKCNFYVFN